MSFSCNLLLEEIKIEWIIIHLAPIFVDYSQNKIFIKVRNMPAICFGVAIVQEFTYRNILENVFLQNPRKLMPTNIDETTVQVLNFLKSN